MNKNKSIIVGLSFQMNICIMEGVEVKELSTISKNEAGATFRIDLNDQAEGLVGFRKAGTVFGGHYHEGKSESKKPEKLAILDGILKVELKNVKSDQTETQLLRAPLFVTIAPFIWHKLEAITDVIFVEMNSLEEHVADTKYP